MADDELEIIPVLDDIVVAGDLDKAITGDIDVKDLESIESFDALFETQDEQTETSADATEEAATAIEDINTSEIPDETADSFEQEPPITDELPLESTEIIEDVLMQPSLLDETGDTEHDAQGHVYPEEDLDPVEIKTSTQDEATLLTSEQARQNQALIEQAFLEEQDERSDETLIEENMDEDVIDLDSDYETDTPEKTFEETAKDTSDDEIDPITDQRPEIPHSPPKVDVNKLVDNVMIEIMPTLETQIRSLVLSSIEKHLPESIDQSEKIDSADEAL